MKKMTLALVLSLSAMAGGAVLSTVASAQATAPVVAIKRGVTLRSSDGRRIGIVDNVQMKDGAPARVQIIFNSRVIYVPVNTITADDAAHFTTSLSYQDVKAL